MIQALAVGAPVVVTRVGGVPDIVGDEADLRVPTEPGDVAAAVTQLLEDAELRTRLNAAGRARFLASFESTGWARRLRALYGAVLHERAHPHQTRRALPSRQDQGAAPPGGSDESA